MTGSETGHTARVLQPDSFQPSYCPPPPSSIERPHHMRLNDLTVNGAAVRDPDHTPARHKGHRDVHLRHVNARVSYSPKSSVQRLSRIPNQISSHGPDLLLAGAPSGPKQPEPAPTEEPTR